mmetsp:Transcript_6206/g.17365  ORF Transcript_6206/g.17365 Transcript_6206/m.17365 type:complete len:220 (+) Transcript_6206:154-813(+)
MVLSSHEAIPHPPQTPPSTSTASPFFIADWTVNLLMRQLLAQPILHLGVDNVAHRSLEGFEDALLFVKVHQGSSRFVVLSQPLSDAVGLVVVPLEEVLAGNVVLALNLGRLVRVAVNSSRRGVDPAVGDTIHNGLSGDVEIDDQIDIQSLVQSGGLLQRSRKSVQKQRLAVVDKPVRVLHNEADHNIVRYQLALVHVLLGLVPDGGALPDVMSQNIAGR